MPTEVWVFLVTSAIMLAATVVFAFHYFVREFKTRSYLLLPLITGIAGLMYGVMTLSAAGTLGSVITEARYVDWLLTTPLIVAYIGITAGAGHRLIGLAIAADVVMIAAGYVATVTTGAVSWTAFVVASIAFLVLLYLLAAKITAVAGDRPPAVRSTFRTIRDITIVLWCIYPLLWLAGPHGFGLIQIADYHFTIAILDLAAKVGFDAIVAARIARVTTALEGESTARLPG